MQLFGLCALLRSDLMDQRMQADPPRLIPKIAWRRFIDLTRTGKFSPEADVAVAAFDSIDGSLQEQLLLCSSGRELAKRGFAADAELAAELDESRIVPVRAGRAYIAGTAAEFLYNPPSRLA
jgi:hypothetical protein